MSDRAPARLRGYVIGFGCVVVATALRLALDPVLGTRFPFATLFFAVLLTAWYAGFGPAILATLSGALASMWFLLSPRYQLFVTDAEDIGGIALYLAVGIGIAAIGGAMRRASTRAEAEARKAAAQREQWRVTLHSIGDAVITTDVHSRIESMNAVAAQLTGWSAAAALGQPLDDVFRIVNEDTRVPTPNPATQALAEGRVVGLANHTLLIARDGTERPIDDSAAPILDIDGHVRGIVLVFRDVSARRLAEHRIRSREQELSDFFDNANVGLHWVGPDGTILRANRAELEMLGYTSQEYVGRNIAEFHADADVIADILARLAAGETLHGYPARMRCKDGTLKDVSINSSVLWEQGKFIRTRCFTLDVTERNRADEAQAYLAAVVESSDDAIVTKTLDGIVTSWNRGAEQLFGFTSAEAVGQPITIIIPPDRHDEERHLLARLRRGERIEPFDTVRMHKSGRRLDISVRISPIRDRRGRIIGASKLARDISASRAAEQALRESEEALREADRRKDAFLATLAHELRNPLAPLRNSLEILKRSEHDRGLMHSAQATMDRQLTHLERLVDDLLDIARISRDRLNLHREPVELATIVALSIETCRPLADAAGLELSASLPAEPIVLNGDAVRLSQVFSNLLNNACKFTPRGGRVQLEARREGNDAIVTVRDTGRGIPAELLPRVFDMFTQLESGRTSGGLGIGLTLVRRLVELHGGSVEGFSQGADRGSEFVVRLPVAADIKAPVPAISPTLQETPALRRRILVVDDNADAAESLATLLELSGHETALAHDGEAAIEVAQRFRPDVVLLDIGLPKMNGHDAARWMREQPWGRDMMIVALTGWGQDEDRRKSQSVGFDHHLVKPVDLPALMDLIDKLPSAS